MIERIGFVGGGVMAEAIIRGLLEKQIVRPEQITVADPLPERRSLLESRYHVQAVVDNWRAAVGASVVVLAVKPQQIADALADLREGSSGDQFVLSIAAGVTIHAIAEALGHDRIVRVMPNTPAQIGAGMSVWTATEAVRADQRADARMILQALGREVFVADEKYLDMATAINGSGPAYFFLFLEALIDAGVHIGLARPVAEELVLQTALGSILMARDSGKHLAELKNMVTSPGGTTAAALFELEDGRLRAIVDRAVVAAYERSKALGK